MTLAIPVRSILILAGVAVWVLLWGTLTVGTVLTGVVVASAPLLLDRQEGGWRRAVHLRPLSALRLFLHVARLAVVGTARVAWEVLTPRNRGVPGEVSVPYGPMTDGQLSLLVGAITVTPGTIVVDIDPDAERVTVHALQLEDATEVAREVLDLRERIVDALPLEEVAA